VIEVVSTNPESLKSLSIPHARIYGTAHVSDKISFLNYPVPTYVIREGRDEIKDFIRNLTQKFLQRLNLELSKLANLASALGAYLWEPFKIYYRTVISMMFRLSTRGLLFSPSSAFKAMKSFLEDRNGWSLLDTEGMLVAVHLQKRMRSLR
jgi:hypothetical protein